MTDGDLSHAYLGSDVIAVSEQPINTALLIGEACGQSLSVIDSMYHSNEGISYPRHNDARHISGDFLNSLDAQVKTRVSVH
jgi:hypothetical protein